MRRELSEKLVRLRKFPWELAFWLGALLFIYFTTGPVHEAHFTLCPIGMLGMGFCPGCGLGHSIGEIFRGEFLNSFYTHPLGFFALGVILHRIFTLTKHQIKYYGQ